MYIILFSQIMYFLTFLIVLNFFNFLFKGFFNKWVANQNNFNFYQSKSWIDDLLS